MSNSGFEYSLGVAVKLGPYGRTLARPDATRAERIMFTPFAKFLDSGSAYVQLTSQQSGTTSYFYDNGWSPLTRVFNLITMGGAAAAASGCLQAMQHNAVYAFVPFLTIPPATVVSMMGPGAIRRRIRPLKPSITISYPLSKQTYEDFKEELSALCKLRRKGVYSPLFNNCADFAVAFAKDHGFDVPEPRIKTPYNLYTAIEKRYKNQIAPQ